ncbi:hypothetical protein C0Q70_01170 [Pomacea canaliculata]|uniref:Uncharacterized protein n=1 Tax=Pomacea canaliculata TaxID=400727 RepID=A0A2T7PYQ7_POMCA|nr:hypothetical protein C0Q70_01170 [Pomacea canaliculata]
MGEPSRSYEDTGETSRLQPVFSEGQLSFIGHDASEIPIHLMQEYTVQTVHLDLSFNRLWQLNGLERFTQLKTLVLDNNEIGDDTMFPHIESLDTLSLNKNRQKNTENTFFSHCIPQREPVEAMTFQYSPLPKEGSSESDDQHIGTYGHSKYVYFGRHSEGNRFIRNKDL